MSFKNYITLGRSGLRVSPLCLGTMTFGTEWGLGTAEPESRSILNQYLDAGGNFIDTANVYNFGTSEKMLGNFLKESGKRDRVVLATKFTFNLSPGDPNAGGNGRKNILQAVEASLHRMQTDYIDLYWLHAWDTITPPEEVLSALTDLVRAGKIRYYGFSNTPSWYIACVQTLADQQGKERLIALQLEYSLAARSIEREHLPAAQHLGLGICPWSPLAGGILSGKYKREGSGLAGEGRFAGPNAAMFFKGISDKKQQIIDTLAEVAKELSKSPAQVALNWCATQPGVTSPIIGATKAEQLADNLSSLDFEIPAELRARLDLVSDIESIGPYSYFTGIEQQRIAGETSIRRWIPTNLTGAPSAAAKAVKQGA
jgi:aryl-alcohol dehydrogenase-like predicted oxidoreductase